MKKSTVNESTICITNVLQALGPDLQEKLRIKSDLRKSYDELVIYLLQRILWKTLKELRTNLCRT